MLWWELCELASELAVLRDFDVACNVALPAGWLFCKLLHDLLEALFAATLRNGEQIHNSLDVTLCAEGRRRLPAPPPSAQPCARS